MHFIAAGQDVRLSDRDWLKLHESVEAIYAESTCAGLAARSAEAIVRFTNADRVMFAVTDNPFGQCIGAFWPKQTDLPSFMPAYERMWRLNPVGQRYGNFGRGETCDAARLTDCISDAELKHSEFAADYLRPARIDDYITAYMPSTDGYRLAVTAFRGGTGAKFLEYERDRMELLRRHIVRAFQSMLVVRRLRGAPVQATELLHHKTLRGDYVIRGQHNHGHFLPVITPPLSAPTLSPREKQVLHWLCRGKTNPEIATILTCSPRTIQKHVEHIFAKLEVPNRASATSEAIRHGLFSPYNAA